MGKRRLTEGGESTPGEKNGPMEMHECLTSCLKAYTNPLMIWFRVTGFRAESQGEIPKVEKSQRDEIPNYANN